MRHSTQAVEAFFQAWHARHGDIRVSAAELASTLPFDALLVPPINSRKVGRLLEQIRDYVSEAFTLEAERDEGTKVWSYRLHRRPTQEESDARLARLLERPARAPADLSSIAKLEAESKRIERVQAQQRRQEEEQKRFDDRAQEKQDRRQLAALDRSLERARQELLSKAPSGYAFNATGTLEQRIKAFKAEAARLETDPTYQRIRAELVKARHEPSGQLIATVIEIERLRGRPYTAGMSLNLADHTDFSSRRAYRAMSAAVEPDRNAPIRMRGGWDPFKF